MANEVKIVGESDQGSLSPQESHAIKVEERAKKEGWTPLEEWDRDPEDWVAAKEYLERKKLYGTIRELKSDLQKQSLAFQKDLTVISQHFAKMREVEYRRALNDLEAKRDSAIAEGEVSAVKQIDKEIKEVESAQAEAKQIASQKPTQQAQESPVLKEWREKNQWFDNDQELREEAISIGVGHAVQNPSKSQEEVLEYVARKIKKMNPEKFQKKTPVKRDDDMEDQEEERQTSSKVESGGGNSGTRPKSGKARLTVHDLNEQELSVMKTFIKRGVLKDAAAKNKRSEQEEYLAQLSERR